MKVFPLFISSALALSCLSATAKTDYFSYDYAQVGYYFANDSAIKGGVKISTSYDIYDHVNILGSYSFSLRSDRKSPDNYKTKSYSLGLGYHASLDEYMEKTDLFVEIALLNTHSSITTAGVNVKKDDSGRSMAIGLRKQLSEKMELTTRIDRPSVPVSDSIFSIGMLYKYSKTTALGLDFTTGADDGSETLTASMRWSL